MRYLVLNNGLSISAFRKPNFSIRHGLSGAGIRTGVLARGHECQANGRVGRNFRNGNAKRTVRLTCLADDVN